MARHMKLDPHTKDPKDPVEMMCRLMVGGSYRVPVGGRSTNSTLSASDIAAAVGLIKNNPARETAMAVAMRADPAQLGKLTNTIYRNVARLVKERKKRWLDMSDPANRWRLRMVVHDAASDLVWPEKRVSYARAAKAAKMRQQDYVVAYKDAKSVLIELLEIGRVEFKRRLWDS